MMENCRLDSCGSGWGHVSGSCAHGNEPSRSYLIIRLHKPRMSFHIFATQCPHTELSICFMCNTDSSIWKQVLLIFVHKIYLRR